MLSVQQISDKVHVLKQRYVERDAAMQDILAVRRGQIDSVAPEFFPEGVSRSMVANFIDVAARDISEVLAPLPSINCSTANSTNDRAKKKADKKAIIANHYMQFAKLQTQMYVGADWYLSYGFLPIIIEPDFEYSLPRIRVENPLGAYPEYDRHGRLVSYTKRYVKSIRELIVEFPEYESQILGRKGRDQELNTMMELIRYEDKEQILLFLPERGDMALLQAANPMGELMVRVARRPGVDPDNPRGQFDDIIFPQIARARFAWLAMDAAEKSVNAPFVVPNDVEEFAFGPDAILRSSNPSGIGRVPLQIPNGVFQEQQTLEQEMRMGARYPEGRSGNIDASIVTGTGVQALLGGFDTQVKASQQIFQELFQEVIEFCFKMDERLFGGIKKIIGSAGGASYELEYDPIKDIAGDHTVQARYGLMAGLDPNRALIFALQALQANLISRDFVMRELPWSMNVSIEQEAIDVEAMRNALSGSLASLSEAIPQMASQGQDPSDIVSKIAEVINLRRKGKMIEEAVSEVFTAPAPQPTAPEQQATMSPDQMLAAMGGMQSPETTAPSVTNPVPAEAVPPATAAPTAQAQAPDINSILSAMGGQA
jgi:hypothetical protein